MSVQEKRDSDVVNNGDEIPFFVSINCSPFGDFVIFGIFICFTCH